MEVAVEVGDVALLRLLLLVVSRVVVVVVVVVCNSVESVVFFSSVTCVVRPRTNGLPNRSKFLDSTSVIFRCGDVLVYRFFLNGDQLIPLTKHSPWLHSRSGVSRGERRSI